MRVALILSGIPRNFKYCFPYLKKYVIDELNPDLFFSGYTDPKNNVSEDVLKNIYNFKKSYIRNLDSNDENHIWKEYGSREIKKNCMFPPLSPAKTISQYYNMMVANRLKVEYELENDFKFDVVIRSRIDYYYYRTVTLRELSNLKENSVYMPSEWDFSGYTDAFAYGDSCSMNKYFKLFKRCREYNLVQNVPFSNESLMGYHIRNGENLTREVIKSPFWFDLEDFKTNGFEDRLIGDEDIKTIPKRRKFD